MKPIHIVDRERKKKRKEKDIKMVYYTEPGQDNGF